jgi:hypothetical protein
MKIISPAPHRAATRLLKHQVRVAKNTGLFNKVVAKAMILLYNV